MKCKCLVLNNREPIPETLLSDVDDRLDVVWYQRTGTDFSLTLALQEHSDTKILISTYMDLCQENLEILASLEVIITTTISTHFVDSDYCKKKNIKIFKLKCTQGSLKIKRIVIYYDDNTEDKKTPQGTGLITKGMISFTFKTNKNKIPNKIGLTYEAIGNMVITKRAKIELLGSWQKIR